MPKSRREKKVALTSVKKKGRGNKDKLLNNIRECAQSFSYVYIFDVENMKNSTFKQIREDWRGSKFFMGKNKVMSLALGRTPEEEQKPGLYKVAQEITGSRGLLFTNSQLEDVEKYFADYSTTNFARSGFLSTRAFRLAAGALPQDKCPHPIEPMLRKLGLPTRLNKGIIELLTDVDVCKKGDVLTPEQCKILEIFGVKLATFRVHVLYQYKNGELVELDGLARSLGESGNDEDEEKEGSDEPEELRTAGEEGSFIDGLEDDDQVQDDDDEKSE